MKERKITKVSSNFVVLKFALRISKKKKKKKKKEREREREREDGQVCSEGKKVEVEGKNKWIGG